MPTLATPEPLASPLSHTLAQAQPTPIAPTSSQSLSIKPEPPVKLTSTLSPSRNAAALSPLQPILSIAPARPLESSVVFAPDAFLPPADADDRTNQAQSSSDSDSLRLQEQRHPFKAKELLGQAGVECDPELGCIRATPTPPGCDPELGCLRGTPTPADCDPELGCVRVTPAPPQAKPARQPAVYLIGRLDYFRSSNVFSGLDPIEDGLMRPGLTLFAAPALGPNTYFVGSIDGNLVRYSTQSTINYSELRFRAGVFQRLSPNMFGEIGWTNQQLFISGGKLQGLPSGTRFLNDNAFRFELSRRDQLAKRLSLNTFYQLYVGFAEPEDRSRVINSLIASLSYDIQPNLQTGLDYQFALADFTRQDRVDYYHQLVARLSYTAFRNTQLSLFGGFSFGNSTDRRINFDSLILGVSLTVNLGLF